MNGNRSSVLAATAAAVVFGLAACAGSSTSAAAPGAAPSSSAPAPAASSAAETPRRAAQAATNSGVADVDCGPITAANGQTLKVVAKGSPAGVAGCTDAINVLTEYFQRGSESQGTAHELAVQGWQCSTIDNGVTTEVITGCDKDGLSIQAVNS